VLGSIRSPGLAIVPVVDVPADLILLMPVALLDPAFELIAPTVDHVEIIVGQLAPLLLDLAFDLLPVPFDSVPVHLESPSSFVGARARATQCSNPFARGCTALRGSERPGRSPGDGRKRLRRLSGSRE